MALTVTGLMIVFTGLVIFVIGQIVPTPDLNVESMAISEIGVLLISIGVVPVIYKLGHW